MIVEPFCYMLAILASRQEANLASKPRNLLAYACSVWSIQKDLVAGSLNGHVFIPLNNAT